MILNMKPLNLVEVKNLVGGLEEKKELRDYLKKYGKLSLSEANAKKIADELRKLDNLKIKEEHIVKIIDFVPKNSQDLNRIFQDVSLDEKEINDILEIVKRY